jgi:hypothetical protein
MSKLDSVTSAADKTKVVIAAVYLGPLASIKRSGFACVAFVTFFSPLLDK